MMWLVEIAQQKTYESCGETRSYCEKVEAEFPRIETALSYCESTLRYMKNVNVTIWHKETNMKEGE